MLKFHTKFVLCAVAFVVALSAIVSADVAEADELSVLPASVSLLKSAVPPRFGCPLCDSSVYSYCSTRLFHDACCCRGQPGGGFGYPNCPPTNCNYLHANSCYEHSLIVSCCCNNPYR